MRWELFILFVLVPAVFVGLDVLDARVSGWSRLAQRFRAEQEPIDGTRFGQEFLRIGGCDYYGRTTIRVSPKGLYLAVWPFFFTHPPLLIPWSELRILKEHRWGWRVLLKMEIASTPITIIYVPLRVIDAGREWLRKDES